MNNRKTYRLFSLTMALLLLVSSAGFSLDMHFCSGKFKRANIFGNAKTCAEVALCAARCGVPIKSCHNKKQDSCETEGFHDGCCDNQSIDIDFDFDSVHNVAPSLDESIGDIVYCNIIPQLLIDNDLEACFNSHKYKPPLIIKDIPVIVQSFLL